MKWRMKLEWVDDAFLKVSKVFKKKIKNKGF